MSGTTASQLHPIAYTSIAILAAIATKLGLTHRDSLSTVNPGVRLLGYSKSVVLPTTLTRSVSVEYLSNGSVVSVDCQGVVGKNLDPVLAVCTDLGSPSRTDRPTVRAWVLKAESAISKSAKALPRLTSAGMAFLACSDKLYPKSNPGFAFEISLVVTAASEPSASTGCV